MKYKINYLHLSAEFIVVVIGVAVALAAESWRQNIVEASKETAYIDRLKLDIQRDKLNLESDIESFSETLEATNILISALESPADNLDVSKAASHFALAARTFTDSSLITQDIVYQELIYTGDLNIIQSSEVREHITRYYRRATLTEITADSIPTSIQTRFRGITGNFPYYYIGLGNPLTSANEIRLLQELENDSILRELRIQRSALIAFIARLSQMNDQNEIFMLTLNNYRA